MPEVFTKLANYNPRSPGLFGPLEVSGFCQHDERVDVDTVAWFDFDAPLMSGSIVAIFQETPSGIRAVGKRLQFTPDGRWWGTCFASNEPDSLIAMPIGHPSVRIGAIAAMVAKLETPRATPREASCDALGQTPEAIRHYDELGGAAVAYWRERGFPPATRWDFQTPPENVAAVRAAYQVPPAATRFPMVLGSITQ